VKPHFFFFFFFSSILYNKKIKKFVVCVWVFLKQTVIGFLLPEKKIKITQTRKSTRENALREFLIFVTDKEYTSKGSFYISAVNAIE
jgi:hypothetical protein